MRIAAKFKSASKFWKVFTVVLAVLIVAMIITWIALWRALVSFENTRPSIVMTQLVEEVQSGNYSKLLEYSNAAGLKDEVKAELTAKLKNMAEGQTITYEKAFSKDKDNYPAFTLKYGGEKLAKITLEHSGNKHSFGFEDFKIMSVTELPGMDASVTVTAPSDYSIFIDGELISDSDRYVAERDIQVEGLAGVPEGYFTKPTLVKYQISDLVEVPEVTAKQPDGRDARVSKNGDGSECTVLFGTASEPDEYYKIALSKAKLYSQYVTAWVGQEAFLSQVLSDSPVRDGLESIQTGFYTDHKKDYFTDEVTENLQIYSENCFSCDISYTQWVEDIRTNHDFKKALPSSFTFYFVKDGGTWYIADLSLR